MSLDTQPAAPRRTPTLFHRLGERYRWMSLRNKLALWGLLIAIVIGVISLQWVRPAYRYSRMWFYLHLAEDAAKKKNYPAAFIAYRKVLSVGNEYPESWKALVKFLDEIDSPEAINIWERLSKMEPNVPEHRYHQAKDAFHFGRISQAEETLKDLPEEWQTRAEVLRLKADIAIRRNQSDVASKMLVKLLEKDPNDQRARFDLTFIRAQSPDFATQSAARAELEKLADGSGEFSLSALRQLIAMEQAANPYEADRLAGKLVARAGATVQDRLAFAQLELATQSLSAPVTIAGLRDYAAGHPADFETVLNWFMASGVDSDGTGKWIAELPPAVVEKPQVQGALFSYYLLNGAQDKVFEILRNPSSPFNLSKNEIELVQRALQEHKAGSPSAEQTWMTALYAVEDDPQRLHVLGLIASADGWDGAAGRALNALVDAAPGNAGAWRLLVEHEVGARNLTGLYKALQGLMKIDPYNINVASKWALVAALIQGPDMSQVVDVAKRTYNSTSPSDADSATAYAFALLQTNQPKEAMAIVDKMSPADRRVPERALYVGAILAANGRRAEALEYLQRSEDLAPNLFPEERVLLLTWKGVAKGELTSAQEVKKTLEALRKTDENPAEIDKKLRLEIGKRRDPAETQRILENLKAETQNHEQPPKEVQQLLREVRQSQSGTPEPAHP